MERNELGPNLGTLFKWNSHNITQIETKWRAHVEAALARYKQEHREPSLDATFVIPSHAPWPTPTWGLHLALIVHQLHRGGNYDGHVAFARTSLGIIKRFFQSSRHKAWDSVFRALQVFYLHYQHCNVRPAFVVPDSQPWPKELWTLSLGQMIDMATTVGTFFSAIGRHADRLRHINFSLVLSHVAYNHMVAPLIALFAKFHPRDTISSGHGWGFTIPSTDPWPREGWGVQLGVLVQWNSSRLKAIEREWRAHVLLAYDVYQYEHGNTILCDSFVVPSRSPWPYKTWGRELRRMLTCVQVGQPYGGHVALASYQSNEACIVSRLNHMPWKTSIFPALDTFAMVFGHCAVPEHFVVPRHLPWPTKTFGLHLGALVTTMETNGQLFAEIGLNANQLETFGFRYKLADLPWQAFVAPLLEMYARDSPYDLIPEDFVVPPKAPWPLDLYGFRLGKVMAWSARFMCQNAQWKEFIMPESTTRAGQYGYCKVPGTFQVPSECPWPKSLWTLRNKDVPRHLHGKGNLFLSGGLDVALASGKEWGVVVKLATEGESLGDPQCQPYTATVEQIECSAAYFELQSSLDGRKRYEFLEGTDRSFLYKSH